MARPAHLQRGREPRDGRRAPPAPCSPPPRPTASGSSSSTTARRTGPGAIADRLAAAHPGEVEVLHRTERAGLGPAYLAGFGRALDGGAGFVLEMDADLSHDPADIARLLAAARAGADLALGSRYVPGGGIADWGRVRRADQPRRVVVRAPRPRRAACATSPAASSASAREALEALDLATRALARLRLPGRADLPRAVRRRRGRRGADRLPRPPARASRRCRGGSRSRRPGSCPRSAAARARAAPDAADRLKLAPAARRSDVDEPSRSRPRPGPRRHARRRCGAGTARRWRVRRPLGARVARRLGRAAVRRLGDRAPRHARPTRLPLPGVNEPAGARARSAQVLSATRSCSPCTPWPASPASSPAASCRRRSTRHRGLWRRVHDARRPAGDRVRRRRDAVLARHPGLRARQRRRRPWPRSSASRQATLILDASPPRAARADRAVPAARRLAHRQPPRAIRRAARGDRVTVAIAVPVLVVAALDRGLRLAAPAAGAAAVTPSSPRSGSCRPV